MEERIGVKIPLGWALLQLEDGFVTGVSMRRERPVEVGFQGKFSPLAQRASRESAEYFEGSRREFDLPIRLTGTEFQNTVWETMRKIPYGQVRSYGDVAFMIGKPTAARAVGGACNKNPLWLLVPCHRVIAGDGSLGGYGGASDAKRFLLRLEGASFRE